VTFVQIGSNDGTTGDPLRELAESNGWAGVLVEPVPYVFERLRAQRAGDDRLALENAAIADRDGSAPLYHLRERGDDEDLPEWYDQLGSFSLPTILKHEELIPNIRELLVTTDVRTLTFDSLCAQHGLTTLDVLHIDVEGYDWEVLRQVDLARYRPDIVLYERVHLSDDDAAAAQERLTSAGYAVLNAALDTVAAKREALTADEGLRRAWQQARR
jgi:FkbM family methyltransferase